MSYIYPVSADALKISTVERVREIAALNDISVERVECENQLFWYVEISSTHPILSVCHFETAETKSVDIDPATPHTNCSEHSQSDPNSSKQNHRYMLHASGGVAWGLKQYCSNSICFAHTLTKVLFESEETITDQDTLDRKFEVGFVRKYEQIDHFIHTLD